MESPDEVSAHEECDALHFLDACLIEIDEDFD